MKKICFGVKGTNKELNLTFEELDKITKELQIKLGRKPTIMDIMKQSE